MLFRSGMNYYETYAPVVTWFSICLLIVIGILSGWSLRQCDFIMAYPQAPIQCDMYMELPQGIQVADGDSMAYVLKLLKIFMARSRQAKYGMSTWWRS